MLLRACMLTGMHVALIKGLGTRVKCGCQLSGRAKVATCLVIDIAP